MFCKKGALRNFAKFTGEHLYQGLWHRCFPVNFTKFLRTPFFTEHLRWLLLSIVTLAACMFLETSVTVHHTQNPSVLGVSAQQCLISFETVAHRRELELQLFSKWLRDECTCFVCGNYWDLHILWFCVLNKNESLRVLKPDIHFCLT